MTASRDKLALLVAASVLGLGCTPFDALPTTMGHEARATVAPEPVLSGREFHGDRLVEVPPRRHDFRDPTTDSPSKIPEARNRPPVIHDSAALGFIDTTAGVTKPNQQLRNEHFLGSPMDVWVPVHSTSVHTHPSEAGSLGTLAASP